MKEQTTKPTYQTKMADEVKTMSALKRYLCEIATGGLTKPHNKRVEAACAACKSQCAYGIAWLERFWAEEDRKWEQEHRNEEHEREIAQLARLKGEYDAMKEERKLYENGSPKPNSFLNIALKPKMKR